MRTLLKIFILILVPKQILAIDLPIVGISNLVEKSELMLIVKIVQGEVISLENDDVCFVVYNGVIIEELKGKLKEKRIGFVSSRSLKIDRNYFLSLTQIKEADIKSSLSITHYPYENFDTKKLCLSILPKYNANAFAMEVNSKNELLLNLEETGVYADDLIDVKINNRCLSEEHIMCESIVSQPTFKLKQIRNLLKNGNTGQP